MPRVHFVKKARKDNPAVKAGESYYWWATRMTVGKSYVQKRHYSATYPKRSQLTSSPFLSQIYAIEDELRIIEEEISADELREAIDMAVSDLEALQEEAQESLDNMPEPLQETSILNERIEAIEDFVSELESIDTDAEGAVFEVMETGYQGP